MIQLDHVCKEYPVEESEPYRVLKDISLTIKDGEFTAIMGPSGSGKSTLMHIIGLLDKPTSGDVIVDDKQSSRLEDNALSTLRNSYIGFVFQQFNLLNKLTVLENIALPAIYAHRALDFNPQERALYLLERVGLEGRHDSYPNKMSGGQQQRVAIARALIMNPRIVLADEPTGNLDTKTGEEIMRLLAEINKKDKRTFIIVTHEPNIADQTKRIIKMVDGKIV